MDRDGKGDMNTVTAGQKADAVVKEMGVLSSAVGGICAMCTGCCPNVIFKALTFMIEGQSSLKSTIHT